MLRLWANRVWENLHDEWRNRQNPRALYTGGEGYICIPVPKTIRSPQDHCFLLRDLLWETVRFAEEPQRAKTSGRQQSKHSYCRFVGKTTFQPPVIYASSLIWKHNQNHIPKLNELRVFPIACHPADLSQRWEEDIREDVFY